jgi:Icc-related predicted phosphoesterase
MKLFCFSDTHGKYSDIKEKILDNVEYYTSDIFVYAGDFSTNRYHEDTDPASVVSFINFLNWCWNRELFKSIIFVPGNHDWSEYRFLGYSVKEELTRQPFNVHYLNNNSACIDNRRFYGTPELECEGWAFSHPEDRLPEYFQRIPDDTEILVTHTPPKGILSSRWGSSSLLAKIKKLKKLKIHIFGHIHEENGIENINGIKYINCSVGYWGSKRYDPIVIEI